MLKNRKCQLSKIATIVISLFLIGCAQLHKETPTKLVESDKDDGRRLVITTELNESLSSEHFGMMEFVLENRTEDWLEIENIELLIENKTIRRSVRFTRGEEFSIWNKAVSKKISVENYNKSLLYGSLLGVAGGLSATNNNSNAKDLGKILGVATLGSLTVDEVSQLRKRVEGVDLFPGGNLLNPNKKIPPDLFVESWLLINTRNHDSSPLFSEFKLKITYSDKASEVYLVPIFVKKSKAESSVWQNTIANREKINHFNKVWGTEAKASQK